MCPILWGTNKDPVPTCIAFVMRCCNDVLGFVSCSFDSPAETDLVKGSIHLQSYIYIEGKGGGVEEEWRRLKETIMEVRSATSYARSCMLRNPS